MTGEEWAATASMVLWPTFLAIGGLASVAYLSFRLSHGRPP